LFGVQPTQLLPPKVLRRDETVFKKLLTQCAVITSVLWKVG